MKVHHKPWHWAAVAAVLGVALLTLSEAHGQNTGASAVYEGRPAMAGAQAGTGPMAGPPQGGISPQTIGEPGGAVGARRQLSDVAGPSIPRDPGMDRPRGGEELSPRRDRDPGNVVKRDRAENPGKESTAGKAKRAGKRTVERAKRGGVGQVD